MKIDKIIEQHQPPHNNSNNSRLGTKGSNPIDDSKTIDNSKRVDNALWKTNDLIEPEYKPWFAKQAIRLGADKYLGIADDARSGKQPKRLFVWLLNRA